MRILLTVLLFLALQPCLSQTTLCGKVVDEKGEPVPSANIAVQDTYDGTSSAADGSFTFETTETGSRTLVVSSIGYVSLQQPIELTKKTISLALVMREAVSELNAVEISAGSFTAGEEKRRTVLKALDIVTTAGATADIAGVLNTLPGTQKVGESGRLFVRGGDGNETRTFIDGMAVLNAYNIAAPNTPSRGRFSPFMFKGTSFSTGGYSAEYGQALSSALVLNSKDKVEMNQTDIGILSVGADVAHTQVWNTGSWSGKIQYTNIRPYFGLINQRIDWIAPPVSLEGSTALRQKVGKNGMFKFFGNFNRSNYQLYNHDIADPSITQRYELTNKYSYGNASYSDVLNEKWNIRAGLSYTLNDNDASVNALPLIESERGLHGKLVLEHSISDRVEVRMGTEVITRRYAADLLDTATNHALHRQFDESILSWFAETEAYASNRFVMRAGARLEYNSLTNKTGVDPRISFAYKPGNTGQFSLSYGKFRQSPNNIYVRINNQLGSEKADHFILNYQVVDDNRTFRIEAYYKKYSDLVRFRDAAGRMLTNAGDGYAKGIELFWRDNKTFRNVDYWISYSYLDTKRTYLNFPYAAAPSFASAHNFSIVGKRFFSKLKSQVGLTYSYSSPRPYNDPNTKAFNGGRTPSYQDLSANLSYLPKPFLIIHVSCTNLLGRDNIFGYQYSTTPNHDGVFQGKAIQQAATRFLFVGVFFTISQNKTTNQLQNL